MPARRTLLAGAALLALGVIAAARIAAWVYLREPPEARWLPGELLELRGVCFDGALNRFTPSAALRVNRFHTNSPYWLEPPPAAESGHARGAEQHLPGTTCLVEQDYHGINLGHFAPKFSSLFRFLRGGGSCDRVLFLNRNEGWDFVALTPWERGAFVAAFGGEERRVPPVLLRDDLATGRTCFSRIVTSPHLRSKEWLAADEVRDLRESARAAVGLARVAPSAPRMALLVQRRGSRRIVNEDQVLHVLSERLGLETRVATFETASFEEQVRAVGDRSLLVAMHGGALHNLWFLPPGARVLEIFPATMPWYERLQLWLDCRWLDDFAEGKYVRKRDLARAAGVPHAHLVAVRSGECAPQRPGYAVDCDAEIDPEQLAAAAEALLTRTSSDGDAPGCVRLVAVVASALIVAAVMAGVARQCGRSQRNRRRKEA
jgi:hypothetical protein